MHFLNWFKLLQDCIRAEKERPFQLQPTPGTYLFLALTRAAAQPASCIGEIDWLTRSVFYFGRFKTSFRWHSWSSLPHSHIIINVCKSRGRVPFLGTAATDTATNTLLSHLVTQDTFIWAYLLHLLEIQTTNVEQVWHAPNNNKKYSFNLYENRPALSNFKVFITETGHCLLIS